MKSHTVGPLTLLLAICLLLLPSAAAASDDESWNRPPEHDPGSLLRRSVYSAARFSLTLDGMFSMTSSSVELLDGGNATDRTAFFRLEPQATIAILPGLEVGVSVGMVARRLARENADSATDIAFAGQPLVRYHLPVSPRFALYGQAGAGMFLGRSSRDIPVLGETLEGEQTATRGFILTTGAGLNYRLGDGLQIRFGLKFNGLWGREAVVIPREDINESLSISTTNFGTSTGLRYTF
jgi:opacity protein-like surface antigen